MEDDDGESSNTESQLLTDSESLKIHHNSRTDLSDISDDEKEEEEEEEEEEEIYPENFPTRLPNPVSHPVFKGLKRRAVPDAQTADESEDNNRDERRSHATKRGKITEYAQYLGLQPAAKYKKCSKCNVINSHRLQGREDCLCASSEPPPVVPEAPPPPPVPSPIPSPIPSPSDSHPSTSKITNNFRITRKVYLCAACGTYFENWNLFLHMRDIHKRHICLFCLGLFGEAERLSHHLENKHNVTETPFNSVEDFYNAFRSSCYLICCSCEKVFTETDNFYNHFCPTSPNEEKSPAEEEVCSVCRQTGGTHSATCQRQSEVKVPAAKSGEKSATKGLVTRSKNNRVKRSEKQLLTSYQRKLTELYARKMTLKSERKSLDSVPSETVTSSENSAPEVLDKIEKPKEPTILSRDTVAETIMEVSKCASEGGALASRSAPAEAPDTSDKPPEEPVVDEPREGWDSVTETIMRVSRLNEERDAAELDVSPRIDQIDRLSNNQQNALEDALLDQSNNLEDSNLEKRDDSSSDDAEDYENNEDNYEEAEERRKKLESTPMSVSTVNRSKGSLVIKICTNKNSHYSVSTPNMNGVDESEDNNNGSDSDNDRLTVALAENSPGKGQENAGEPSEPNPEQSVLKTPGDETEPECRDTNQVAEGPGSPQEHTEPQLEAPACPPESVSTDSRLPEPLVPVDHIQLASEDVCSIDLNVNGLLESLEIVDLLKGCIEAASPTCVYCNHARHIAVNGKQLALHMLAEHRFQPQHPAIILQREQFINRIKKSIDELDQHYFNYDSYDSKIGTYNVPNVRIYECFHCRVTSHIHKDLYLHNRKMHQKTILICIMCKSTFYSYSELLCHLCPGIYSASNSPNQPPTSAIANPSIKYRCCICSIDALPSAFRLMVHLRKQHHACDVCLELTGNQQRLSNHVWKHKLHHLCYRCGIAYRNKPDITKHLFWKHGTESVVCKKCLQKKWPHIYHFCIPPSAFVCEECSLTFTRAVALKVHKRLHSKDEPYGCTECKQRFISKKLLIRHEEDVHRPPPEPPLVPADVQSEKPADVNGLQDVDSLPAEFEPKSEVPQEPATPGPSTLAPLVVYSQTPGAIGTPTASVPPEPSAESQKPQAEPVRKVVDVYDLPPLNLSSDSDSDDNDDDKTADTVKKIDDKTVDEGSQHSEKAKADGESQEKEKEAAEDPVTADIVADEAACELEPIDEQQEQQVNIMNGIWDNFKSYATTTETNLEELAKSEEKIIEAKQKELLGIITADHDYCVVYEDGKKETDQEDIQKSPKARDLGENGVDLTDSIVEADQTVGTEVINELNEVSVPAESDAEKKKTKSPKKKTTNSNSSSSDSSSDSDSSSCSCGTNCSCSTSSSDSSSSSSSSSDSDSSASESSPRKQSEGRKRERKKTKTSGPHKRTKENPENDGNNIVTEMNPPEELINVHIVEETPSFVDIQETGPVPTPAMVVAPPQPLPPVPKRNVMRESDLETDETDTDEDFYDEHPQELANKMLAEKRNQLMLLASVAAPSESSMSSGLKNGTIDNPSGKKKIKVKKRKKTGDSRRGRGARSVRGARGRRPKYAGVITVPTGPVVDPIKLNIPNTKVNRAKPQPRIRFSSMVPPVNRTVQPEPLPGEYPPNNSGFTVNQVATELPGGSDTSVNENKRSSKRKRIPKKFYGDSSDDEQHQHNQYPKWRRVETNSGASVHQGQQGQQGHQYVPTITIKQNFGPPLQSKWYNAEEQANFVVYKNESAPSTLGASVTDTEDGVDTSSESSGSEAEQQQEPVVHQPPANEITKREGHNLTIPGPGVTGDKKHLYCYCQCPYDEVSEMIACDGSHCRIEWFHFECVGIAVPPKGKWYCPDCRRDDPSLKNDEFID